MRRYIVSGMSKVVLMAYSISHHTLTLQYGFIDLCMIQSVRSCRAVYEKFKDGTTKDISDELPFEIPATWRWVRLGNIFEIARGGSPRPINEYLTEDANGLNWIKIADATASGKYITATRQKIKPEGLKKTRAVSPGDLLLTNSMSFGHPYILQVEGCIHDGWLVLHPLDIGIDREFFYWLLSSSFAYAQFTDTASGGVVQNLNTEKVIYSLFPLPPLAEQKRIVAKIENLMPFVEEYGKMEETRLQLDADLPSTLEKSILQEAIQGKLVPQDPNDEPASELLKRIATERKALVKAGKLKRDKGESVIFRGSDRLAYETRDGETVCIQDEIPFEIPDSWEWVRLGDMSNYGQCTSVGNANIAPGTWSLDLEEIEKGTGRLIERKTAAEKKSKSCKHVFTKGTLLYSKLRTYLNKVLVADMDGVCTSEIVPIELNGGINAEYVRLVLMSPYFLEYTASKGYGIKMPRVGTDDMKQSLIPLPPLDEQKRIVKRVEELKSTVRTLVTF